MNVPMKVNKPESKGLSAKQKAALVAAGFLTAGGLAAVAKRKSDKKKENSTKTAGFISGMEKAASSA